MMTSKIVLVADILVRIHRHAFAVDDLALHVVGIELGVDLAERSAAGESATSAVEKL